MYRLLLTTSTDCKAYFTLYLEQAYADSVDLHRTSSSPSIVVIIIYGAGRKNLTNVRIPLLVKIPLKFLDPARDPGQHNNRMVWVVFASKTS